MDIGINGSGLLARPDMGTFTADLGRTEADGLASYWLAQTGGIDALTVFAAHGDTGSSMQVGTAVIPAWVTHPQVLAGQAMTTQAATGGRLVLGIGLAHEPSVTGYWKLKWEKPIRQMLDYLNILQPLLAGEAVKHDGYFWSYEGTMPRFEIEPPKVMLAALGDQMLKIAGSRTDGTILWCVGPKTIKDHIAPKLNDAAEAAGRSQPSIVCSIPVWVTDDVDGAREFIAKMLSIYAELPSYRAMLDIEGLHGLGELSIVGSHDEVVERIGEIADSGATDFTAVPMGANPDEQAATRDAINAAAASS